MTRLIVFAALFLAACKPEVETPKPLPVAMTETAVGHYCQMDVLEHDGPKAQIHLAHLDHPIWFTQVRDAVTYLRLPEETATVTAVYVSDMGMAADWTEPGAENWIDGYAAIFVIGSTKTGGMGAPEAVPFSTMEAADTFIVKYGGSAVRLAEIPDTYILAPVEIPSMTTSHLEDRQ